MSMQVYDCPIAVRAREELVSKNVNMLACALTNFIVYLLTLGIISACQNDGRHIHAHIHDYEYI